MKVDDNLKLVEHTGLVTVGLLDTSGGGGGLASGLGGELLTGSLATSGLTCEEKTGQWNVIVKPGASSCLALSQNGKLPSRRGQRSQAGT